MFINILIYLFIYIFYRDRVFKLDMKNITLTGCEVRLINEKYFLDNIFSLMDLQFH